MSIAPVEAEYRGSDADADADGARAR